MCVVRELDVLLSQAGWHKDHLTFDQDLLTSGDFIPEIPERSELRRTVLLSIWPSFLHRPEQ